ncbi:MAG: rod-binding protein [Proteobacteria bacterium]|nr:rod-binding protein [Pseudomonadota bacterium]MBU1737193.1 rod-binding protein [Pseudomonadota bacterium]
MGDNNFVLSLKKTGGPTDTVISKGRSGNSVQGREGKLSRDEELRGACKDFEAILLRQLLSAMRKSIPKGELFGDSHAREMYQTLQDEALADQLSRGRGAGLGEVLYRQLSGQNRRTVGNR